MRLYAVGNMDIVVPSNANITLLCFLTYDDALAASKAPLPAFVPYISPNVSEESPIEGNIGWV